MKRNYSNEARYLDHIVGVCIALYLVVWFYT